MISIFETTVPVLTWRKKHSSEMPKVHYIVPTCHLMRTNANIMKLIEYFHLKHIIFIKELIQNVGELQGLSDKGALYTYTSSAFLSAA